MSGENYPPKPVFLYLSYLVLVLRFALILMVILGPDAFIKFGLQPPSIFERAYDNKIVAILLISIVGGQIETMLVSTGAFEVTVDGQMVWSKLEIGRLPSADEVLKFISSPGSIPMKEQ